MTKKIVVIGGGHGQSLICRGIKKMEDVDIGAIVTVADDGGSTGRLRREFHIPAMGDIRNVLISLAEEETLLSSLMDYRFDDPNGTQLDVQGHNLGNLILTALTDQTGSFLQAIHTLGEILNVKGQIIPATTEVITLYAQMQDGVIVKGEANIPNVDNQIHHVFYQRHVDANPEAIYAIQHADLILYGIGSVYTSILPNVIIPDIKDALRETKAKRMYVCNAMTQPGETDSYSVEDHVNALIRHGAVVDGVLVANDVMPEKNIENYRKEGSTPVRMRDKEHDYKVFERELLTFRNGLIRHDADKVKNAIEEIVSEWN